MRVLTGEIEGKDYHVEIASNWEELNPNQAASILQTISYKNADATWIKVSVLSLLFTSKNFHILTSLEEDQVYALIPLTDFVFNTKPELKNYFPEINLKKKKHIAPKVDLSNIGFGEWCFAYEYYNWYFKTRNEDFLNKLIATLYRPIDVNSSEDSPEYSGDLREIFNENLIEKRAKSVCSIQTERKTAILTWFSLALLNVMDRFPHVFPKSEQDPEITDEERELVKQQNPEKPTNWITIFRELLGPKFGTSEQLKFTNAQFVLAYLEEQHIAFKEAKTGL